MDANPKPAAKTIIESSMDFLAKWAGSPSWSVRFGVFCCCLRCYTYSHCWVSL